jgi:hypothetical protein
VGAEGAGGGGHVRLGGAARGLGLPPRVPPARGGARLQPAAPGRAPRRAQRAAPGGSAGRPREREPARAGGRRASGPGGARRRERAESPAAGESGPGRTGIARLGRGDGKECLRRLRRADSELAGGMEGRDPSPKPGEPTRRRRGGQGGTSVSRDSDGSHEGPGTADGDHDAGRRCDSSRSRSDSDRGPVEPAHTGLSVGVSPSSVSDSDSLGFRVIRVSALPRPAPPGPPSRSYARRLDASAARRRAALGTGSQDRASAPRGRQLSAGWARWIRVGDGRVPCSNACRAGRAARLACRVHCLPFTHVAVQTT